MRALYGHPEAGALWEARLDEIKKKLGWSAVPGNGGVYVHAKTKSAMAVYVDDMLLLSAPRNTELLWRELEKCVDYEDPAAPLQRYVVVLYQFDAFDPSKPTAPRSLLFLIYDYAANAVQRFKTEFGQKLTRVTSPYISFEELNEIGQSPGRFSSSASSHVATLLFLSRVARPDISVAVQRLCRVVTKWTTTHDAQLIRLYAYLNTTGPIALHAALSLEDLDEVQLVMWSDADWAGDPEDTK